MFIDFCQDSLIYLYTTIIEIVSRYYFYSIFNLKFYFYTALDYFYFQVTFKILEDIHCD